MIKLVVRYFLLLFGYEILLPARLGKKEESRFDKFCNTIAPYVIVACIILLTILVLIILVKYGGFVFGTEANHFYNGDLA